MKNNKPDNQLKNLAGAGMQMAITSVLLVFFGVWLDKKTGITPIFTIAGAVLAVVSVFYILLKKIK